MVSAVQKYSSNRYEKRIEKLVDYYLNCTVGPPFGPKTFLAQLSLALLNNFMKTH